jgi:superfamily II RNA helicase
MNKSEEKKLRTRITTLSNKIHKPTFETYWTYTNQIKDLSDQIQYQQTMIHEQYQSSYDELVHMGYIQEGSLTQKGVIASHIASGDEILLTELILNERFLELDLPSMASVLSIFCDDTRGDECEMGTLPSEVYRLIDWIFELNQKEETTLTDKFAYVVYLWISGKSYFEILPHLPTFEGDFIRAMLKFSHICDELLKVCEIMQFSVLEKKLIDIKSLLVRDIITSDSLYLKL